MNEIGSYDYIDNEKYKRIENLLEIMKETFGFENETPEEASPKKGSDQALSRADSIETGKPNEIELN